MKRKNRLRITENMKEYKRQWRKKNPEKIKEYQKRYYLKNKETIKENSKRWKKNNPGKIKRYRKQWDKKNREKNIENTRKWREKNPYKKVNNYPLGFHHTEETKRKISNKNKGKIKHSYNNNKYYYGGFREDLGHYVRSRWEANIGRYLKFLIEKRKIKKYEYEVDCFEFKKIKRGNRSYTPDFKVFNNDGNIEYWEVKGWMDKDSKVKLKRMGKYYPEVKIILIGKKEYREIEKWSRLIPNWE